MVVVVVVVLVKSINNSTEDKSYDVHNIPWKE